MCKKVGETNGIPQYELCADYRYARAKQHLWAERLENTKYYLKMYDKKVKEMQKTHCPLGDGQNTTMENKIPMQRISPR
jgi:hypothetical protein